MASVALLIDWKIVLSPCGVEVSLAVGHRALDARPYGALLFADRARLRNNNPITTQFVEYKTNGARVYGS